MIPLTKKPFLRLLNVITVLMLLITVYVIFSAIQTIRNTGTLVIKTSDKKSLITLSQTNKVAKIIGSGEAKVRLRPGSYLIVAAQGGRNASAVVTIALNKTTNSDLQLSNITAVPSADNIVFTGLNTLITNGLTTAQADNLRQLFFEYKQSTKAVMINTNSVQPGAFDPNGTSSVFSITFSGSIDSKPFTATVTYSGLTDVQITLTNPSTGTQMYYGDSTPVASDS